MRGSMLTPAMLPCACRLSTLLLSALPLHAGITLAPLTSFGGGDGWRSPGEILPGDIAGSNNGIAYNYLGAGSLERGMAYNPVAEKIVLVSRNGGNHVRLVHPLTGEDAGGVSTGTGVVSGGLFPVNMAACDKDGVLYVSNMVTNATTGDFKIYKWADLGDDAPTVFFQGTLSGFTGTPRFGDSLDLFDGDSGPVLAAGGSGVTGYVVVQAAGATAVPAFTPDAGVTGNVTSGDFRLGTTFAGTSNDVWGRQSNGFLRRTTWNGGGIYLGTASGITGSQNLLDFAEVGGTPMLAVLNAADSTVTLYDVTNPAAPAQQATGKAASGTLTANSNGTGSIKWGKVTTDAGVTTAQLYAMSTNQGMQAFTVTVSPEAVAPVISAPPASRTAFLRGQTTFTVAAQGTPPLSYQWLKGGEVIPGATSESYTINPITAASAGEYVCRVSNAALPPAESAAAVLTVDPGMDTMALTPLWNLKPGDRSFLTEGDFQRGLAANPAGTKIYLASRTSATAASLHVLDAGSGEDISTMDVSGISGGLFVLNMLSVAEDGVIYGCNLSNADGTSFRIYQWPDDMPATAPAQVYDGSPGLRTGDSFAARGSGAETLLAAGTNAVGGAHFLVFRKNEFGSFDATSVTVAGAADRAFSLGIGFGPDNTVWGKGSGTGITVATLAYDAAAFPPYTATLLSVIPAPAIPGAGGVIAVDAVNSCLAHIHAGAAANSDNVRLYRLPALNPPPVALEWLDQEFYATDNANGNAVGQAVFAAGKLFALNTNNGLAAFSIAKPLPPAPDPVITDVTQSGSDVSFKLKATMGKTYVIEKSTQLDPFATWTADGTVTVDEVEETITRPMPAGTLRLYFRAREQRTVVAP